MKEGRVSSVRSSLGTTSWGLGDSGLAHLSMAPSQAMSWVGAAPVAQFSSGPSCGQGRGGACRSKGLVAGQHVPDRLSEPAADLDRCQLRAALVAVAGAEALADRPVARVTGGAVRGLDECPAQVIGPVLAQRSTAVTLARLLVPRAEAGVADELARAREAGDVADLGGDREGEHPADSGTAQEQRHVAVRGPERAQLALAAGDLLVERVDQAQAGGDRRGPGLGQPQPLEQRPAADAEEVAARARDSVLEEDRVHTVLERAAVFDQVQAEAGALTLGPHLGIGQPDLGDELAAGELREDAAVDLVGLAGERRQPLDLDRVGDLDLPAPALKLVVHEAGAAHRFDRGHDLGIAQFPDELLEPVRIRRYGADRVAFTAGQERLPVEALAAEVQSDVQHCRGLPSSRSGRAEFLSAGGPPSSDSVAPRLRRHLPN